ncbi:MAG: hypothetical protein R6U61_01100 [Thermoplasmata archaeon]
MEKQTIDVNRAKEDLRRIGKHTLLVTIYIFIAIPIILYLFDFNIKDLQGNLYWIVIGGSPIVFMWVFAESMVYLGRSPRRIRITKDHIKFDYYWNINLYPKKIRWEDIEKFASFGEIRDKFGNTVNLTFLTKDELDEIKKYIEKYVKEKAWNKKKPTASIKVKEKSITDIMGSLVYFSLCIISIIVILIVIEMVHWIKVGVLIGLGVFIILVIWVLQNLTNEYRQGSIFFVNKSRIRLKKGQNEKFNLPWASITGIRLERRSKVYMINFYSYGESYSVSAQVLNREKLREAFKLIKEYADYHEIPLKIRRVSE